MKTWIEVRHDPLVEVNAGYFFFAGLLACRFFIRSLDAFPFAEYAVAAPSCNIIPIAAHDDTRYVYGKIWKSKNCETVLFQR